MDPLVTAYLALARETQTMQDDLTQSLGPDDARRAVYGDQGCWWNSSHGVGPRGGAVRRRRAARYAMPSSASCGWE